MTTPTPTVGQTVLFDGRECPISAVAGEQIEFADGSVSRGTHLSQLAPIEPGKWGVVGRTTARPHRAKVGVSVTATEG